MINVEQRLILGQKLKQLREGCENSPSGEKLVDRLAEFVDLPHHLTGNQLNKWENGRTLLPREVLFSLIKLFAHDRRLNLSLDEARQLVALSSYVFSDHEFRQIYAPFEFSAPTDNLAVQFGLTPSNHRLNFLVTMLNRAVQMAWQQQHHSRLVQLSIELARVYQQQGYFQQGITLYEKALPFAELVDDQQFLRARVQSNLAYLYTETNEVWWDKAEQLCMQSLRTFADLKRRDKEPHVHNHLGVLYTRWQRAHPAQFHLDQACQLWEKQQDEENLRSSFINLGLFYLQREQAAIAHDYLNRALHLTPPESAWHDLGTIQLNLALSHQRRKNWDKAEESLKQAETTFTRHGSFSGLAQVWHTVGLLQLDQEHWFESHFHLDKARQLWQQLKNPYHEILVQQAITTWQRESESLVQQLVTADDLTALLHDLR